MNELVLADRAVNGAGSRLWCCPPLVLRGHQWCPFGKTGLPADVQDDWYSVSSRNAWGYLHVDLQHARNQARYLHGRPGRFCTNFRRILRDSAPRNSTSARVARLATACLGAPTLIESATHRSSTSPGRTCRYGDGERGAAPEKQGFRVPVIRFRTIRGGRLRLT